MGQAILIAEWQNGRAVPSASPGFQAVSNVGEKVEVGAHRLWVRSRRAAPAAQGSSLHKIPCDCPMPGGTSLKFIGFIEPTLLIGMKSPARRLSYFILGFLLSLGSLELLVRRNSRLFEAASHRALAKAAMFEQHSSVNLLFLGTSRTQDGVSPDLVTRTLGEVAPELGVVTGFNAAFTGSSLDALTALIPRFGFRADLRVVVIELAEPQIANPLASWVVSKPSPETLEDRLADSICSISFIRYRTAFLSDNLGRLPALLFFASSLGGWEARGVDQIAAWLGRKEPSAVGFDPALWTPELFMPTGPQQTLSPTNDSVATQLGTLARQFQDYGIKVIFSVPPLSQGVQGAPERNELKPVFAEVARRGRCEVWNFAPLSLPRSLFRDPSHLGKMGRAHYSRALGVHLARVLKSE